MRCHTKILPHPSLSLSIHSAVTEDLLLRVWFRGDSCGSTLSGFECCPGAAECVVLDKLVTIQCLTLLRVKWVWL